MKLVIEFVHMSEIVGPDLLPVTPHVDEMAHHFSSQNASFCATPPPTLLIGPVALEPFCGPFCGTSARDQRSFAYDELALGRAC